MAKKMVSIEDVEVCFQSWIDHLKRRCADWEGNVDSIIEEYCRADRINANTSLNNVGNIMNHAGEIKAIKMAIEELETVRGMIERSAKEMK